MKFYYGNYPVDHHIVPIKVWNDQVPRTVKGATICEPQVTPEPENKGWGVPEWLDLGEELKNVRKGLEETSDD